MISYKEKLPKITTFIFDVDGVLTDGSVTLYQDEVVRTLNSRDGYALQYAAKMGYAIFIITGGSSIAVKNRLLDLGIKDVFLNASNKIEVYQSIKENYQILDENVLYMGDDIPDYYILKEAGVATCPQDAVKEIKSICDYTSPISGGKGCVRDVIEQTLSVQDKWFTDKSFIW
jgi:3-deoxy-D-manno-octulosonate 8-phosphate phosphatase (KDO 8-P phosphatase)